MGLGFERPKKSDVEMLREVGRRAATFADDVGLREG
jgi:hypothetical protein